MNSDMRIKGDEGFGRRGGARRITSGLSGIEIRSEPQMLLKVACCVSPLNGVKPYCGLRGAGLSKGGHGQEARWQRCIWLGSAWERRRGRSCVRLLWSF